MTVWSDGSFSYRREPKMRPELEPVVDLIGAARAAGEEYGACHIVLADLNIDTGHIDFCLARPEITDEGRAAMLALKGLTKRSRAIVMTASEGGAWARYTDEEWLQLFSHNPQDEGFAARLAR